MRFTQRKLGWIGVDVGTSSLKVAQAAHGKYGWRLAASVVVPRQQAWQADETALDTTISSLDEIRAARSLQTGYQGRAVAAALPMSLCDIHRVDRALQQEAKADQILRKTIETATQQSAQHTQCDYWSTPASDGKPGWTQALAVPRSWTERICEDIAQAGWSCRAIDGLPQAMVRAVGLVAAGPTPAAALDWGHGRATLCLIDQGQASYVRCLKGCGLGNVLKALVDKLQVTETEAQRLLEEIGLSAASPDAASLAATRSIAAPQEASRTAHSEEVAQLVHEIIAEPISQLVEEINRSLAHYQFARRSSPPELLYLFGGGAMIRQLADELSRRLGIDVRKWRLPADDTEPARDASADCLLAPAIALSALAWETP